MASWRPKRPDPEGKKDEDSFKGIRNTGTIISVPDQDNFFLNPEPNPESCFYESKHTNNNQSSNSAHEKITSEPGQILL